MKFFILAAALLPAALGHPAAGSQPITIRASTVPKFNQYANGNDCASDTNILFHASPVVNRCYDMDEATGSYFVDTGVNTGWEAYDQAGCKGNTIQLSEGQCLDKGNAKSMKIW